VALYHLDRPEDEIAAYDELIEAFVDSGDLVIREQVAAAMLYKGNTLDKLGRRQEAITAYDILIARFANANEPALTEHVTTALRNRRVIIGEIDAKEAERAGETTSATENPVLLGLGNLHAANNPEKRVDAILALLPKAADSISSNHCGLADRLTQKLRDLGAKILPVQAAEARETVTCIQFPLRLEPNELVQNVRKLDESLSVHLNLVGGFARVSYDTRVGELVVELPKAPADRETLSLTKCLASPAFRENRDLTDLLLPFGQEFGGGICIEDLADLPHLLVAGTTGSGKTVFLQNLIIGLTTRLPSAAIQINIVDPKMVDFMAFHILPHLGKHGLVTEAKAGIDLLKELRAEVEKRFNVFKAAGHQKLAEYNEYASERSLETFRPIVTVIDEFGELSAQFPKRDARQAFMTLVARIAQLGRAAGVHLVIATQHPNAETIPTVIKANLPARVGFNVAQSAHSQVILDESGAETLLGKGDALFKWQGSVRRFQSPYASPDAMRAVIARIASLDMR
jgi:DNA segregation ATPase FtsK/SpoIIIE-like protein